MEWLSGLQVSEITGTGAVVVIAWLVITRKLVWHTDLEEQKQETRKAESDAKELQRLLYVALGVADKLTVQAELTNEVMSRFPDPAPRDEAR